MEGILILMDILSEWTSDVSIRLGVSDPLETNGRSVRP